MAVEELTLELVPAGKVRYHRLRQGPGTCKHGVKHRLYRPMALLLVDDGPFAGIIAGFPLLLLVLVLVLPAGDDLCLQLDVRRQPKMLDMLVYVLQKLAMAEVIRVPGWVNGEVTEGGRITARIERHIVVDGRGCLPGLRVRVLVVPLAADDIPPFEDGGLCDAVLQTRLQRRQARYSCQPSVAGPWSRRR